MGRSGACRDNAATESLRVTLATEYHYRRACTTRDQVHTWVAAWIEDFCKRRRVDTSLASKSPSNTACT